MIYVKGRWKLKILYGWPSKTGGPYKIYHPDIGEIMVSSFRFDSPSNTWYLTPYNQCIQKEMERRGDI